LINEKRGITLDYLYDYAFLQEYSDPVTVAQSLSQAQILYAQLYAELLPKLGYDFLAKFKETDLLLLALYLQGVELNIDPTLDSILKIASQNYHNSFSTFLRYQVLVQNKSTFQF
jgi:hypothetical protein